MLGITQPLVTLEQKNVGESLFIAQELKATATVLPFPSVSFFPDGSDRVL